MATNDELLEIYASLRRKMSLEVAGLLKRTGLGTRQFSILKALSKQREMKVTELVDYCMTDAGTISRSLNQLEEAGLIEKLQSEYDGRVWIVKLTKKGQGQIPKIQKVYSELSRRCFAKLKAQEKNSLAALLTLVSDHIANQESS